MATTPPIIQILSRNNYEDQYLVSLPNTLPLPELTSSSIRLTTSIISLTANNLTYGRVGHILRIWDIYPLPSSIPAEYSDPKSFGRIGVGVTPTSPSPMFLELKSAHRFLDYSQLEPFHLTCKFKSTPKSQANSSRSASNEKT